MDTTKLLDMLPQAAFLVRDGRITYVNPPAAGYLLEAGAPIDPLLFTGHQEYTALEDGSLYLLLQLGTALLGSTVTRNEDGYLFLLEPQEDPALQALSLAAAELRVPLSGAMYAAERLSPDSPEAARMQRSLHQLLRRIGNMADAARYTENPTGTPEVQNICGVLDEIFEKAATMASMAGITVTYQGLSQSLLCPVDGERLERAVYNLIANAVRFSEPGATIHACLQQKGKTLCLTVSDTGSGIPTALQSSLFSRYQRQPGFEDPRHGLGLGMVLIRAAAAAHGGTVLVRTGNDGTRITLTFSLSRATSQLRSPIFRVDYAGNRDHALVELSDILPPEAYL